MGEEAASALLRETNGQRLCVRYRVDARGELLFEGPERDRRPRWTHVATVASFAALIGLGCTSHEPTALALDDDTPAALLWLGYTLLPDTRLRVAPPTLDEEPCVLIVPPAPPPPIGQIQGKLKASTQIMGGIPGPDPKTLRRQQRRARKLERRGKRGPARR